jgi:hypothetical protein
MADGSTGRGPDDAIAAWEQVWQGTSESAAEIVAGRLQAEGLRANVRGHSFQQRSLPFAMQGAWAVYTPVDSAGPAREILRAHGEASNVIEPESEHGLTPGQRDTIRFVVIGVLLIAIAGVVAAIRGS